jgi:hypothetical protein
LEAVNHRLAKKTLQKNAVKCVCGKKLERSLLAGWQSGTDWPLGHTRRGPGSLGRSGPFWGRFSTEFNLRLDEPRLPAKKEKIS